MTKIKVENNNLKIEKHYQDEVSESQNSIDSTITNDSLNSMEEFSTHNFENMTHPLNSLEELSTRNFENLTPPYDLSRGGVFNNVGANLQNNQDNLPMGYNTRWFESLTPPQDFSMMNSMVIFPFYFSNFRRLYHYKGSPY